MDVLMLLLVIQGWVLSLFFFTRKHNVQENRLLGALVSVIALTYGIELFEHYYPNVTNGLWILPFTVSKLTIPVLLYVYIKVSVASDYSISRYLFFIPLFVSVIYCAISLSSVGTLSFDTYVDSSFSYEITAINSLFWLVILPVSYRELKQSINEKSRFIHNKSLIISLLVIFAITVIFDVADDVNEGFQIIEAFDMFHVVDILLLLMVYFISYKTLSQPQMVHDLSLLVPAKNEQPKYSGSGVSGLRLEQIRHQLEHYMQTEAPYLKGDLTIQEVANTLKVSRQYLSQVLSEKLACNFNDYVNRFRIEEFKKRAIDPRYKTYTILALAYDSGFNSKTTFNNIFKKYTGKTPSQFRKEYI
ncbi:AraC family transcriptional regulator [Marinilabiliaceae bacterium JC017]|nr:AraC family transcriptional regulator [Marinilabiliaceae bacterium JC017]